MNLALQARTLEERCADMRARLEREHQRKVQMWARRARWNYRGRPKQRGKRQEARMDQQAMAWLKERGFR
jgi:hypothetical protein